MGRHGGPKQTQTAIACMMAMMPCKHQRPLYSKPDLYRLDWQTIRGHLESRVNGSMRFMSFHVGSWSWNMGQRFEGYRVVQRDVTVKRAALFCIKQWQVVSLRGARDFLCDIGLDSQ